MKIKFGLFVFILLINSSLLYSQVAINVDGSNPNYSAMLDVKSSNKGFLPPRMTQAEMVAIPNPADGLIVYCTDCRPGGKGVLSTFMDGNWNSLTVNCYPPMVPILKTLIPSSTGIVWGWKGEPYATGYKWNISNDYATAALLDTSTTKAETGLSCNTPYTRYVWAFNGCGNSLPLAMTQATLACSIPTLSTTDAFCIALTTATSGGNVTDDGGASVTARGVCWSTSPNPTTDSSKTTEGSGTGMFTSTITGLTLGTTYYIRAYATNSEGTAYGNEVSAKPTKLPATVKKDGSGNFTSIQSAIDASVSGDTVLVYDGTYYERITLKGGVQVLGAGANVTIINGGGSGTVVTAISVAGAKLDGFTITNGHGSSGSVGMNGGGIYIENSNPIISNCIIIGNSANFGGGILCDVPSGTHTTASPTLNNNIISGNSAEYFGGGLYYNSSYYDVVSITMSNNTITGNSGKWGGGGIYLSFGGINISNTIINSNTYEIFGGPQIQLNSSGATVSITNSDIQGGLAAIDKGFGTVNWGMGNIDQDPLFVNAAGNDFRLSDLSPCIGAGNISGAPSKDIEGNPRPNPSGSSPDMGAYENSRATP